MNPKECKFCGFTGNETEICGICGNKNETQNPPFRSPFELTAGQTAQNVSQTTYQNTIQRPPVRVFNCPSCGAEISAARRFCNVCEKTKETKSVFNFLRLAVILVPLLIVLSCTVWLVFYYIEDPVNKTARDFEKVTGITKNLQYDNFKITGTGSVKVRETEPNERGNKLSRENELAFEMVFAENERFYVHFYREPQESAGTKKTVYQAGSNGYRHWQSVLAWSNLGVEQTYRHSVKDTEGFPNILHKNILLGLTEIKSMETTVGSECAAITPEAARIVMSPKMYTIEGQKHNAYPCDLTFLSVQDKKGYSSALGFDPQTGVLLTERGYAWIEDKNAWLEINYGAFKKFSFDMKSGKSTEKRIVLLPTSLHIVIIIDNVSAATIKLNIKTAETNAAFDPMEFEKPIL